MKSGIKSLFNGAAAYIGATATVYSGVVSAITTNNYIKLLGQTNPSATLNDVALTISTTALSGVLFAAGYSGFFGSGKTVNALKKILGEPKPPQP
jgi:hypothetical protein